MSNLNIHLVGEEDDDGIQIKIITLRYFLKLYIKMSKRQTLLNYLKKVICPFFFQFIFVCNFIN